MTPLQREQAAQGHFRAVVLAGERPGGGALTRELNLPAGVLAPLAGRPCLLRVMDALNDARQVDAVTLCGPDRAVVEGSPELTDLLNRPGMAWLEPRSGPAASATAALEASAHYPVLLTSGDHGLLDPDMVDGFCADAASAGGASGSGADVVVGLVPHAAVAQAFPQSRRTVLRFADGAFCGSNLFALLGPAARQALQFWSTVEADRKRPWRMLRRLGPLVLLRYLMGRLSVDGAFQVLSRQAGCRIRWVPVPSARAAVDVDSAADWRLADGLLREDAAGSAGAVASAGRGNGTPA